MIRILKSVQFEMHLPPDRYPDKKKKVITSEARFAVSQF